jgi:hypothetical protein
VCGRDDVDLAVTAARSAFDAYAATTLEHRIALVEKLITIFERRYDEMVTAISTEMGAPYDLSHDAQAESGPGHLRATVKAVRENKTILQTGTQQRSSQRFRMACELVRNKRIGSLKEVHVWLPAGLCGGPFTPQPVPTHLDWDYWQGQAPAADYMPERCHTKFRNWYDYSGGTMTDWGAHHMDIGFWAVGARAAETVEGTIPASAGRLHHHQRIRGEIPIS